MGWGYGPAATASSPGDIEEEEAEHQQQQQSAGMIESAVAYITRLRELSTSSGKRRTKKGKEVDRGDEACQCMIKLAALLKKTPSLRYLLSVDDLIEGYVPLIALQEARLS